MIKYLCKSRNALSARSRDQHVSINAEVRQVGLRYGRLQEREEQKRNTGTTGSRNDGEDDGRDECAKQVKSSGGRPHPASSSSRTRSHPHIRESSSWPQDMQVPTAEADKPGPEPMLCSR